MAHDFKFFQIPPKSRLVISGPSCAGKSSLVKRFIEHADKLFVEPPDQIIYFSPYRETWFDDFQDSVTFTNTIPKRLKPHVSKFIIFDDVILDDAALKEIAEFYCKRCSHENIVALLITQNLFTPNRYYRTISLNSSIFVIFSSIRATKQIEHFGNQIFGTRLTQSFVNSFLNATTEPYTYIVILLTPGERIRLRSCVLPTDPFEVAYLLDEAKGISGATQARGQEQKKKKFDASDRTITPTSQH